MSSRLPLLVCLALFLTSNLVPAADEADRPIPGIGPAGPVVKLHTNFAFTEGPAEDRDGNVYFSDIPNEKIYKVDAGGKLSVFREKSNHANGLMLNARGEVVACEMDGQYITSQLGRQVFDPSGRLLGIIRVPEQPANVTFGGKDFKTLYVTARMSLYTIPMEATGHLFAQPPK
jgi:sugar lactone lactonase YvrE